MAGLRPNVLAFFPRPGFLLSIFLSLFVGVEERLLFFGPLHFVLLPLSPYHGCLSSCFPSRLVFSAV